MKTGAVIPILGKPHFLNDITKSLAWIDEVVLVESVFNKDTEQAYVRNSGLMQLDHCDYIFVLDSDEILLEAEAKKLLKFAEANEDIISFGVPVIAYIGDLEHRVEYDSGHHPIVLIKAGHKLHNTRCYNASFHKFDGATLHHLKFLQPLSALSKRTDTKVDKRKVSTITAVPKNDELSGVISARISDNTAYVLEEEWL